MIAPTNPSAAACTRARCPRCSVAFDCECGAAPGQCWCASMPALPAGRLAPGMPCLCPGCLAAELAAADVNQSALSNHSDAP
ncbi:hypothetical protein D7S89_11815 [Trinickia fusca]|uniref:Cysteine-rich CWC family protein n=1 Tax=Trinickia fusca TaxID=2419777 RepID=A0A494XLL6_9BURK|nr:cysteine-rich CWC family protein [Trinickia fusca]RKP49556.1 hypothetical protein D7S89_11815 [Trinickia fusca]